MITSLVHRIAPLALSLSLALAGCGSPYRVVRTAHDVAVDPGVVVVVVSGSPEARRESARFATSFVEELRRELPEWEVHEAHPRPDLVLEVRPTHRDDDAAVHVSSQLELSEAGGRSLDLLEMEVYADDHHDAGAETARRFARFVSEREVRSRGSATPRVSSAAP